MNTAKQETEIEMPDESPVYTGEVESFEVDSLQRTKDESTRLLREELAAERDKRLRLAAEYENYRRRTKLESEQATDKGRRELLEQLISLADDLDLALAKADEPTGAVAEGWRLIHRQFHRMLEANNVVPFNSKGKLFDPERHEAFDTAEGTDLEAGTVWMEARRGYFWNDRLLRPALVIVAA